MRINMHYKLKSNKVNSLILLLANGGVDKMYKNNNHYMGTNIMLIILN